MKKFFLVAIAFTAAGVLLWYRHALLPRDTSDMHFTVVTIKKGSGVSAIGDLLREKGIIRSPLAFGLRARWLGVERELRAGNFTFSPSMSVDDILQSLHDGKQAQISVTIPEGFTVRDIDRVVANSGLAATGAILQCAQTCDFSQYPFVPTGAVLSKRGGNVEGYLFPDTYFVEPATFDPKTFLGRMLATFQERVYEAHRTDVDQSGRTWREMVTMASLIEEETRTKEEKPVVSGILWKRFDAKMGLGVDAALRYILNKPTAAITAADLNIDSPYNLRKYRGLPPGPIANPGLQSLLAAMHPEPSAYWYYLHDAQGDIHYAQTNEEHNENRRRYLR